MTEQLRNLLVSAAIIILFLWLIALFTFSSRLTAAVERLEEAEHKLDTTLQNLVVTRSTIDSVHSDLRNLATYVRDIQGRVEILDLNERISRSTFRSEKSGILRRLGELYKEIETTGEALPEIPVR